MSFRRPAGSIRRPRARSEKREPRPDQKGDLAGVPDGVRWAPVAPSWRINPGTPALVPSKENPGQRQADRGQRRRGPRDGGERAPPRRFNSKTPALVPSKENPGQTPSRTGVIAGRNHRRGFRVPGVVPSGASMGEMTSQGGAGLGKHHRVTARTPAISGSRSPRPAPSSKLGLALGPRGFVERRA